MPCTFSHPLAVVALHRLSAHRLNLAALVIGSMSPDFGYYVARFPMATFAHSILGTFIVCLPLSLLVLALFYSVRESLCFILPQPHRTALLPLVRAKVPFNFHQFLKASASILLGAWTHTIWDSFTHDGAWSTRQFAFLRESLFQIGDATIRTSYVLQQLSTFGAGAALVLIYFRWLRRQPTINEPKGDRWRYILFVGMILAALCVAVPMAIRLASHYESYTAVRVLVFRTAVYSAAVFLPLLTISSVLIHQVNQRRSSVQTSPSDH